MDMKGKNVLLTGASGGIGSCIAKVLAGKGANLALVGRNAERLSRVAEACRSLDVKVKEINADLTIENDIVETVGNAESALGPIDVLINNAGAMAFNPFSRASDEDIRGVLMSNVYGPMRLAREILPPMLERKGGMIVNIGSIFGSLSFPYFGIYSSSKFALRGFSEALRRELTGSGVKVCYIAPRGTRTSQSDTFLNMARETGMNLDEPEQVASQVVAAIEAEKREKFLGGPECFFVFLNKLVPSLIDRALAKNVEIMSRYI